MGTGRERSPDHVLERVSERGCLLGLQLDHEAATPLERHAHHDAAALLGDLERTVTGPRLPRRHAAPLFPSLCEMPRALCTRLCATSHYRPCRTCGAATLDVSASGARIIRPGITRRGPVHLLGEPRQQCVDLT